MKLTTIVSALALAGVTTAQVLQKKDTAGFQKLGFRIHRGDTVVNAAHGEVGKVVKRANSDGSVEVEIKNGQTFYLADLKIGSNENELQVLIDTGSSDLWVMSHDVDCVPVSSSSNSKRDVKRDLAGIRKGGIKLPSPKPSKTQNKDIWGEYESLFSEIGISDSTGEPLIGPGGGGNFFTSASGSDSEGSNTCTSYGSFNTGESDTFKENSSAPAFSIAYADGSSASGIWGRDTVNIGGSDVKDLSFAVANTSSSDVGVLGIGLAGLEVTYSSAKSNPYQYQNLPYKMKADGLIEKVAYSVFLGEDDAKSGTVLFGAVDHSKYSGSLVSVPIVNSLSSYGYKDPIKLELDLDSIKISGGSDDNTLTKNGYTALLDTGSTLSYFPEAVAENLGTLLDLEYDSQVGAFAVDCDVDSSTQLDFMIGGSNFSVPITNFIIEASDGSSSSSSKYCYLGILPQSTSSGESPYFVLGDNFIRNFYVVYDLEDFTISLAKADLSSSSEDIEVISSSIPGASSASDINTSAYTGGREGTATAGHALQTGSSSSSGSDSDSSDSSKEGFGYKVYPSIALIMGSVFVMLCM